MTNMARMEMLATFCMRFLVALVWKEINMEKRMTSGVIKKRGVKEWTRRGDVLSQLRVDGQHLWVADKGERQDWDGVGCLKAKHTKGQQEGRQRRHN